MQYNLKIKDFANDVQVSFYETKIKRGEEKIDKRSNKNNKQSVTDNIQNTWYNPKTGEVEVIPEGFQVIEHPFLKHLMLYPEDRFIDDNVWVDMAFELMLPIVNKKLQEEKSRRDFSNGMRSFRRTQQRIYEIARGSVWELFVTFTVSDEDIRYDIDLLKKRIGKKINNINSKYNLHIKYILIPEQHKDEAWHLHGLFKDIQGLKLVRAVNPHTGHKIIKNGLQVYNIPLFDTIGFNTATYVQNNSKVTKYILKYMTKDIFLRFPGKRCYLCSKNLPRGTELLFDIESGNDIQQYLEDVFGYVPELTHGKIVKNMYTDSEVKYLQYRK